MGSFLIAPRFFSQTPNYRSLQQFRERFDPKFFVNPELILALAPPFQLLGKEEEKVLEEIEDDLDTYLQGVDCSQGIEFGKWDVLSLRKSILFLLPRLPQEMLYLQEGLDETLMAHHAYSEKYLIKRNRKQGLLPIGRFHSEEFLHSALKALGEELSFPLKLIPLSICLYEKTPLGWVLNRELFEFDHMSEDILKAQEVLSA